MKKQNDHIENRMNSQKNASLIKSKIGVWLSKLKWLIRLTLYPIISLIKDSILRLKSKFDILSILLGEPKWLNRITLYSIIFVSVIISSHFIFSYPGFLHTDINSARDLLNDLVQIEAAILAIVISLSLVAVELAASSYSARVIEVFKKTPDLWILIGIYGLSIFYGLSVLKLIGNTNPQINSLSDLEYHISFVYYLGIFAFVALIPYIWNTLGLLNPFTVVSTLAKGITKQNILPAIKIDEKDSNRLIIDMEKDPIQPIMDIFRGVLIKYDSETVRDGLRVIGANVNVMFKTFKDEEEEEKISKYIFSHLANVGKLAVREEIEDSTIEVISTLRENGITAAELKLEASTRVVAEFLGRVGETSAEQKLKKATKYAAESLESVGVAAAKQKFEGAAVQAAESLFWVGEAAAEQKLEDAAAQAIKSLRLLGKAVVEQELENAAAQAVVSLGWVGTASAKQRFENATREAAESLGWIGSVAAEQKQGLERVTLQVAVSLLAIGTASAKQNLEISTWWAAESLGRVGSVAAEQKLGNVARQTIFYLGMMGKVSVKQKLESVVERIVESLGRVGDAAARQEELKDLMLHVETYLREIQTSAKQQNFVTASQKANKYLKKIKEAQTFSRTAESMHVQ